MGRGRKAPPDVRGRYGYQISHVFDYNAADVQIPITASGWITYVHTAVVTAAATAAVALDVCLDTSSGTAVGSQVSFATSEAAGTEETQTVSVRVEKGQLLYLKITEGSASAGRFALSVWVAID